MTASRPALAQTSTAEQSGRSQGDRVSAILGTWFGDCLGANSLERQWLTGNKPLAAQQSQFAACIDADVAPV